MRRKLTAAFAVLSMLLLLAGVALVGYFAWKTGANECTECMKNIKPTGTLYG